MAAGRFQWLGNPRVPADMVYVDSVVHAIALALTAPAERVAGEVFAVSDGDPVTWYDFYGYFAEALGLDIAQVRVLSREAHLAGRTTRLAAGVRSIVYALPAEELAALAGRSFIVPSRELLARSSDPVSVVGPLLVEEARAAHIGFWPPRAAGTT